ncbi:NMRA-LIKE FAMILY DOMAIN-CONTAINING PROTEIN 1 [Ceraceosorus bombacis]|uniref:NMRA-LIKE FAMILY DOMAIN-CONTAINING PROTEIN 1 n=1 Tax=Ceraceosorus bombacis TaxID=401625 RepID=A0A0P1BE34_9BASI|nr:NMRA-LIKE FAMILY DOMAIN-CONTAINING PROTEIN 1 [Ceraceosorus bombacis]
MSSSAAAKRIVVFLSTGKQGTGVVKALSALNSASTDPTFKVLAVTRSASSSKAKAFAKLPGVEILESEYDAAKVFEKALKGGPVYGVFSVQQSFDNPNGGVKGETEQGIQVADEAAKAGVQHLIYSSVDFGGLAKTDIPHFESKRLVEQHIEELQKARPNLKTTILRPTFFMDNISQNGGFLGKAVLTASINTVKKPLQMIACSDIGFFAALAFQQPEKYAGKSLSLAGDELDMTQLRKQFAEVQEYQIPQTFSLIGWLLANGLKELKTMFAFFNNTGYSVNIAELRALHPNLKTWREYVKTEY